MSNFGFSGSLLPALSQAAFERFTLRDPDRGPPFFILCITFLFSPRGCTTTHPLVVVGHWSTFSLTFLFPYVIIVSSRFA